jgi:hypothetical protein
MIDKIEVRTPSGTLLTFLLEDPDTGYVIKSVDGLGPTKATIVSSPYAKVAGSQYQSSHRESRNILIKIKLDPDYVTDSMLALRTRLYSFFMSGQAVSLRLFRDDGLIVDIDGHVESCEPDIFSIDPTMDISIINTLPDFIDTTPVVVSGNTVSTSTMTTLAYPSNGAVESGIELVLNVNRTLTEFTIYHQPADGVVRSFDFAYNLVSGDIVKITTNVSQKAVKLVRSGVETKILSAKSPQSTWITLQPGDNLFRVYAVGAAIPYTLTYTERYGGL